MYLLFTELLFFLSVFLFVLVSLQTFSNYYCACLQFTFYIINWGYVSKWCNCIFLSNTVCFRTWRCILCVMDDGFGSYMLNIFVVVVVLILPTCAWFCPGKQQYTPDFCRHSNCNKPGCSLGLQTCDFTNTHITSVQNLYVDTSQWSFSRDTTNSHIRMLLYIIDTVVVLVVTLVT